MCRLVSTTLHMRSSTATNNDGKGEATPSEAAIPLVVAAIPLAVAAARLVVAEALVAVARVAHHHGRQRHRRGETTMAY